jgi:prepilin-type N-terminal cleavage/methylation domain-containing protein
MPSPGAEWFLGRILVMLERRRFMARRHNRGFTLVELLVVIAIIGSVRGGFGGAFHANVIILIS